MYVYHPILIKSSPNGHSSDGHGLHCVLVWLQVITNGKSLLLINLTNKLYCSMNSIQVIHHIIRNSVLL